MTADAEQRQPFPELGWTAEAETNLVGGPDASYACLYVDRVLTGLPGGSFRWRVTLHSGVGHERLRGAEGQRDKREDARGEALATARLLCAELAAGGGS